MMPSYRTIDALDAAGKRVLIRVDLNVPVQNGKVTDATRIMKTAPTIAELASRGAKVIVLSHFGRPKGARVPAMSLKPLTEPLSDALDGRHVTFADDCIGDTAARVVASLGDGDVALLENVRFHDGEEANDAGFARALATLGDAYVNDAFSAAHRAHASTARLASLLPSYAGRLMAAELQALERVLEKPERPLVAVVGGAKVSTKIELLGNLIGKVDTLVLGGGMANTFLLAQGRSVGKSLAEPDRADDARRILASAAARGVEVILPVDVVVAKEVTRGSEYKTLAAEKVPASWHIVDVGKQTIARMTDALATARTVFWNGPMGVFEIPSFAAGTRAMARLLAEKAQGGATVVVGGGDSAAAVHQLGLAETMTHISTGGGASLEFLEGRELPGVTVLLDRPAGVAANS